MPVDVKWVFAKMKNLELPFRPFSLVPSVCTYNATLVPYVEQSRSEQRRNLISPAELSHPGLSPLDRVSKRHLPSCFLLQKKKLLDHRVRNRRCIPHCLEKKREKNNRLKVHVFKVLGHIFDTFCFPVGAQLFPSWRCAPYGRSFLTTTGFSAGSSPLVWTGAVRRQTL